MEYKEDRYRKRVEILDGFIKAVEHPRETMEIMIGNNNPRKGLQELFSLSEEQAQAILDMRIRVFGEERKKLYEDRRDCEDNCVYSGWFQKKKGRHGKQSQRRTINWLKIFTA